jgi:N-acetylglucosamine-6-phosphate deacetylase
MLCDLQVNGFIGVDFSSPDLTLDGFREASHALIRHGVDVFLPTVITSPMTTYERNLAIACQAIESVMELAAHIPGFHIEGPFISPEPGAIGAHDPKSVHLPDCAVFDKIMVYAKGKIKLLTIAAEQPGADVLARHAVAQGVAVSCGHQLASAEDLARIAEAGATALTHLGNGMPNMVHRHKNPFLVGLGETRLNIMFIPDGHHLPLEILKLFAKLIPVNRLIATSDASPAAGLPPGRYKVLGNDAVLEENGLLHNPEKQCLVGSSATLVECVEVLHSIKCFTDNEIQQMVWDNPRKLIGRRCYEFRSR